jgi:hypothetical protein
MELVSWASSFNSAEMDRVDAVTRKWKATKSKRNEIVHLRHDKVVEACSLAASIYSKAPWPLQLLYKREFSKVARLIEAVRGTLDAVGEGDPWISDWREQLAGSTDVI